MDWWSDVNLRQCGTGRTATKVEAERARAEKAIADYWNALPSRSTLNTLTEQLAAIAEDQAAQRRSLWQRVKLKLRGNAA